ncbi:glycoside hydrolase family 97 catalytic domain-containing protein [Streptomyces asiaticus]|uniref:glycoside hydrolase family 97 catalytic domain-containing protein n=1 Tax=Streptomyces asiaticus TaxID=114695 RepID=UPI003F670A9D
MIIAHEAIKPAGLARTCPNMMTGEGVAGMDRGGASVHRTEAETRRRWRHRDPLPPRAFLTSRSGVKDVIL